MDLIAVFFNDGSLSIYRTISWERLLIVKYSEEVECCANGEIWAKFSPSGNTLAIAGKTISLLDIANNRFSTVNQPMSEDEYIADIEWMEECDRSSSLLGSPKLTEVANLMVISNSSILTIYQYGAIPIVQIKLSVEEYLRPSVSYFQNNLTAVCLQFDSYYVKKGFYFISQRAIAQQYCMANVLHELKHLIQFIKDGQNNMIRKWRDALRVFPPKVELMSSALRGYDMKMGIVEFLHTIILCGLWHPASSVIFSQHWNEQSLSRLRSALDSTMKFMLRTVQLQIIPSIESMIILSRMAIDSVPLSWPKRTEWEDFNAHCMNLLQATDSLLSEMSIVATISQKVLLVMVELREFCDYCFVLIVFTVF
jgi:hypothetical protein